MYIRIFVLFALRIYSYYVDEPLKLLQNVREKMSFFSTIHRNLFPESRIPTHLSVQSLLLAGHFLKKELAAQCWRAG